MRLRLTRRADEDIERILEETLRTFGSRQVQAYAELIDRAIAMVAEEPRRPSSKIRPEIAAGIRSFHVALAGGRRTGASHVLYFTVVDAADDAGEVVILRILHDRMEPRRRLPGGLDPTSAAGDDGIATA